MGKMACSHSQAKHKINVHHWKQVGNQEITLTGEGYQRWRLFIVCTNDIFQTLPKNNLWCDWCRIAYMLTMELAYLPILSYYTQHPDHLRNKSWLVGGGGGGGACVRSSSITWDRILKIFRLGMFGTLGAGWVASWELGAAAKKSSNMLEGLILQYQI